MAFRSVSGGMMRGGVIGGGGVASSRRVAGAGGDVPVFVIPMDEADGPAEAHPAGGAACVSDVSLASMLALQEVDYPTERDRRARRHADTMLDALRALQLSLLEGEDGAAGLQRLALLIGEMPIATHPGLRAATASVALRIELELVRHAAEMKPAP
jgi:hypothetical protein